MPRKKTAPSIKVDSLKHKDKRANIPTEELRDFVKDDETKPKTILYPRDPSLDPQLVWKGKDEQDSQDLAVPAVPIYIQEKIHPQAIIEDICAEARRTRPDAPQMTLFSDFNGIDFKQMVEFYHHQQNWSNRMILGDSLLVMTSLAEKEGLKGKVQTIYFDPPYGIKFGSNWQVSTRKRDVKDGKAEDAVRQPEQVKAFRDTWKLGIHSYLAYLRDRLTSARELLTESGSIFVQIGDENMHLVRCILDEVFGAENCCSALTFLKTSGQTSLVLPAVADYLLWYAKDRERVKTRSLYQEKTLGAEGSTEYFYLEMADGQVRRITQQETVDPSILPEGGRIFATDSIVSDGYSGDNSSDICVPHEGKSFYLSCGPKRHWKVGVAGTKRLWDMGRLLHREGLRIYKRYFADFPYMPITNVWTDTRGETEMQYVVQTSRTVIQRCLLMTTDPGDLVLDPTCGSGTTAYVAEQWGRRWITVDTSRVAIALARTRLMAGRFPYYFLSDSPEGQVKEAEIAGRPSANFEIQGDIRKGFVYRQVPHVTLKSIANNEEIDGIHKKWQPKQDACRKSLNKLLKTKWEEWEVPREADKDWPKEAKEALKEFRGLRRDRQAEIDGSITRHADQETLYDQPYEDSKRVRVTGPFTVESLSPHRVLSTDEPVPASESDAVTGAASGQFETKILDNLRAAGVKSTIKGVSLKFDRIEPYAGCYLHGQGEYKDRDGKSKRVAISVGPEHGTVSPMLVKEAAKEAVQGVGFDALVVCGFAFDPHVSEEATRYGKLQVITPRMNPDLAMGDELLKKTGAGNLFMVFGEPDIDIKKQKDGQIVVEIRGVDVYDPTTGEIHDHSTDDIACWFIDTNYNGESFFVRHAYFCGAGDPYEKLKRALRAEVDESAWSALYSTTSRPFPKPETKKIAIKAINHYGDEVLKVCEV